MRSIVGLALLVPSVAVAQPTPAAPEDRTEVAPLPPEDAAPAADATTASDPGVRVAAIAAPSAGSPAVEPPSAAPLLAPGDPGAAAADPTAPTGLRRRLADDAAAGRTYFTETALTPRRGSVSISLRAPTAPVAELQVRYAIHDRIELGVGGVLIADGGPGSDNGAESPPAGSFHAKGQVWRNDRAAVAVGVSRYAMADDHDDDAVTIPTIVASTCLDGAACTALVSLSLNGVVIDGDEDVPIFAGVGWALGRRLQFVGELHYANDDEGDALSFGYVGLRGAGGKLAIDAGIGFASEGDGGCSDCSAETEAFPFIGLAARM